MPVKKASLKKKAPVAKKDPSLDFFNSIKTGNVYTDGEVDLSTKHWFDTGSYSLNAVLSGDMTRGLPNNRVTMFAGAESVGKSFLAGFAAARPAANEGSFIYYMDTEGNVGDREIMRYGVKKGQFKILPEDIVEEAKFTINNIIKQIEAKKGKGLDNALKCMFILDSQGQLDTQKTRDDLNKGDSKADLQLQKELKRLYKAFVKRMALLDIPWIITSHTYKQTTGIFQTTKVSGGQGGLYGESNIFLLTKRQYKEGSVRKGTLLNVKIYKSR